MPKQLKILLAAAALAPFAAGCSMDNGARPATASGTTAGKAPADTGGTPGGTTRGGGSTGGIPTLVNVNLENVLNNLSVRLNIDRANIPVNAQVPIEVAANVCGVSVSALSLSTGGKASCTAKTATPQLAQVVQQQVAAGGSVGGGAQGGSTASTGGGTGSGGTGSSGSSGTGGNSTGSTDTTNPPPTTPPPRA